MHFKYLGVFVLSTFLPLNALIYSHNLSNVHSFVMLLIRNYLCYDPTVNRVHVSRNIFFFFFKSTFLSAPPCIFTHIHFALLPGFSYELPSTPYSILRFKPDLVYRRRDRLDLIQISLLLLTSLPTFSPSTSL